jgi:hypothetical protein
MAFGRQATQPRPSVTDESAPRPHRRSRFNWLRGGVLLIILGVVNLVSYSQTGKILLGPRSANSAIGVGVVMSVLALIFGVVAVFIHFAKNQD